ncbi:MAG: beta-ketoacyl-[acyl-carrier-protein] synthase family protein [Devosia sp.]
MRKVGITGMGAVSAAGVGAEALWGAARDGKSCVGPLDIPRSEILRVGIAAQVRNFDATTLMPAELARRNDRYTQFAHIAADEAVKQAGLAPEQLRGQRSSVIIGTGIGGMNTIDDGCYDVYQGRRPNVLTVPKLLPSAATTHLSIVHGVTGPCFAIASACSSAAQSIGIAAQLIRAGIIDRAIAGGSEACITTATVRGWEGMRVLSPDLCRPFSASRNGIVLGEGAGVLVLEAEEAMEERGAEPVAWLAGYGTTSDAFDVIQPDVNGPTEAMRGALVDAGLSPSDIDYLNAHGTGTALNDVIESEAIGRVFGNLVDALPVSSVKPIVGHGLGASGGLEIIVTLKAMLNGIVPPQINLGTQDPKCALFLPTEPLKRPIRAALSNSFAFGGINACLVVTAV